MDATSILPKAVWAEVVGKVDNPGDVYACAKACKTFEKLLEGRRDTATSALMLPILFSNRTRNFTKVKTCRLVCYDWKAAVDNYRQSLDYQLSFDNNRKLTSLEIPQPLVIFYKADKNERFLEMFGVGLASTRCNNPFPCRRICVYDSCYGNDCSPRDYWDYMEDIFEAFGTCIWYCSIKIGKRGWDANNCKPLPYIYKKVLYRCLSRMPNLKTLSVHFKVPRNKPLSPRQTNQFTSLIKRYPFPSLQLFKLKLDGVPGLLSDELLKAAQPLALKHLELNKFEGDVKMIIKRFHNLEDFRIGFSPTEALVDDFRWTHWPLARLEMDVDFAEMPPDTSIEKVGLLFDMLNELGETLIALQLVLKGSINYFGIGCQSHLKLALPRLQVLQIVLWNEDLSWESLNFVMDLKELKSLQVHGDKQEYTVQERNAKECLDIQMSWIQSNLMEPSIWEVLPQLNDLEFSGRNRVSFSLERGNDSIHSIGRWSSVKRWYTYKESHLETIDTWRIFFVWRKEETKPSRS